MGDRMRWEDVAVIALFVALSFETWFLFYAISVMFK